MSRTYRRKNQYKVKNRSFHKEYSRLFDYGYNYSLRQNEYTPKSKDDYLKEKAKFHSDSYDDSWQNAPSWFNNMFERKFRMRNRKEIYNYLYKIDYEPICYETPPSTMWEWI